MKSILGFKPLLILSILLNFFFGALFTYQLQRKGGLSYLQNKFNRIFLSSTQQKAKGEDKPYFYDLLTGIYNTLPLSNRDIVFVGDSHIQLCPWSELFSNPRIKNRGIGGDTTFGVLKRIGSLILAQPDKIFIMTGANDINKGLEVQQIVGHYHNLVTLVRQKSPSTQIFILSVLPFGKMYPGYLDKNKKVRELNKNLKALSNGSYILYIEVFRLLADENNNLADAYSYDKFHLNEDGYRVLKNALEHLVI